MPKYRSGSDQTVPGRLGRGLALFHSYSVTQTDSHSDTFIRKLLKSSQKLTFQVSRMGKEHEGTHVGGFHGPSLETVHAPPAHVPLVRTWSPCKGGWVAKSSSVLRKKRKVMVVNGQQSRLQRPRRETEPLNGHRFFFH